MLDAQLFAVKRHIDSEAICIEPYTAVPDAYSLSERGINAGLRILEPGETFTTVELKINFLRPVREAMLRAEGRVVHRGRTIGYVECDVVDENGKLIAKSNSTCLVLRGEKAAGR